MLTDRPARIAITFDLEMCTNFPTWDQAWDLRKGDLDGPTKDYALRAARLVRERGGVMHFFAVGRVFEQDEVGWLQEIARLGHPVGNHTYHHVNVLARSVPQLQHTYARWPWRAAGRAVDEVIAQEVAMTNEAIRHRLGVEPAGFRTPGGFAGGLAGREDVQKMLLAQGFTWVSSLYAGVEGLPVADRHLALTPEHLERILAALPASQPFLYPTGLAEIPMTPLSDIHAFRTAKIPLGDFVRVIELLGERAMAASLDVDLLCHPSCLVARDPHLEVIQRVLDLVDASAGRLELVHLGTLAESVQRKHAPRRME